MLSRTAEYALRATLAHARRHGEAPVAADEIARSLGAPPIADLLDDRGEHLSLNRS